MDSWNVLGRQLLKHCAFVVLFGVPVALVGSQGCTLADDYCTVFCECERCNDRQEDDCGISVAAAFDVADAYDCTAEADEFYKCAIDDNDCDDNNFTIDDGCSGELEDLYDCLDDNSDIIGSNANVGQGPAQQGQGPGGGVMGTTTVCGCACTCTMCTIDSATRSCAEGEGGCESCDAVCTDACLADATCGSLDSSVGQCAMVP